jgi:hypothetical protein
MILAVALSFDSICLIFSFICRAYTYIEIFGNFRKFATFVLISWYSVEKPAILWWIIYPSLSWLCTNHLTYASTGPLYESNQSRTVYVSPPHSSQYSPWPERQSIDFFLPGGLFIGAGVVAPGFYEHSIIATGPINLLHWQLFVLLVMCP